MSHTLSVIVPVYNSEKYLHDCVESILAQTYSDFELLLVDDGSSDSSAQICDTYATRDDRIHVIHKSNEGQLSARRAGLQAATGTFVTCVDSDDVILPNMYDCLMTKLAQNDADIITSGFITYEDEAMTREKARTHDAAPAGIYRNGELHKLCTNMFVAYENCEPNRPLSNDEALSPIGEDLLMQTLCTKIYKKELLKKYIERVSLDIRSWEDLCYSLPPFADATCVEITHTLFYRYIPNPHSTTHTIQKELAFARSLRSMEAAERNYALCGESVLNAFYRKACMIFYMDLWKDYGESLVLADLDEATASDVFKRIVHAAQKENRMTNKRILRFLTPLSNGHVRAAVRYCMFSRFLTEVHVRISKKAAPKNNSA